MENKFKLSHTVLYSKGWYNKTDDIMEDLKKSLILDGYSDMIDSKNVVSIMINRFNDLNFSLYDILSTISEDNCYRVGYYTNSHDWVDGHENRDKFKMEYAIMYYIVSQLRFMNTNDYEFVVPKYSKENPRPNHITLKQVIDTFNSKDEES